MSLDSEHVSGARHPSAGSLGGNSYVMAAVGFAFLLCVYLFIIYYPSRDLQRRLKACCS